MSGPAEPALGGFPGVAVGSLAAMVQRPALLQRLDGCLLGRLGLIVAPAGSGKSVLIAQWLARHPELRSAWLSIEPAHHDARRFAGDLVTAVSAVVDVPGEMLLGELSTSATSLGESFVDGLATELEAGPPFALVLDDFHRLAHGALRQDIGRLLERLPTRCHLLVAARSDPGLHVHRLRMRGDLVEVRQADLAFDPREAHLLLEGVSGRALQPELVAALVDRTEGWAAGLQLAALSLRDAPDAAGFVARFAGDDRFVVDYLTEEVLAVQPPEVRRFLLRTSVLTSFSAELADAVTEGAGAAHLLDELERRPLFVIALDRHGEWFRYHHLFGDLLRYHLRAAEPGVDRELRLRAASWHLERGDARQGVEYLLAAEAWDEALDAALAHGQSLYEAGEATTVRRWLETVAAAGAATTTWAQLALLLAQVVGDHPFAAEETYRRLIRRGDLDEAEQVCADALYAGLEHFHLAPETVIEVTDRALARLPAIPAEQFPDLFGLTDPVSLDLVLLLFRAKACLDLGRLQEARHLLERVLGHAGARYPVWRIHALGVMALWQVTTGHLVLAHHHATAAVRVAQETGLQAHIALGDAYLALGAVAVERHEPEQAALHLREGWIRAERARRFPNIDLHRLLRARLDAATVGYGEALATLRQPPAGPAMKPVLAELHRILEARFLVGAGEPALARTVLARRAPLDLPGWRRAAEIAAALAIGGVDEARAVLDGWTDVGESLRDEVERSLWAAVVLEQEGDDPGAHDALARALALAEPEGLRRPFLDAGPVAVRLLRNHGRRHPSPFSRSVLEARASVGARRDAARRLADPLTDRELAVVGLLPSRLTNAEVAGELFVSLNTLKTHLRNIYRKLDAPDRDAAVDRASELGLL